MYFILTDEEGKTATHTLENYLPNVSKYFNNKRNPNTSISVVFLFLLFLACIILSLTHKHKNMVLDTHVCFRVPPVCTLCSAFERPADKTKITSDT
jgi:hypothetical protein